MIARVACSCFALVLVAVLVRAQPKSAREIAITIDDLPWVTYVRHSIEDQHRLTTDLLTALGKHRIPAIGFVNEQKLLMSGTVNARQVALLQKWIDAGLDLGNHTFSHADLHAVPAETYQQEIERGDVVTRSLLARVGKEPRYFRHPFLRTGRSLETKRAVERFLATRGYRVAPVSVDNYDYMFAAAFDRATGSAVKQQEIADAYLAYMTAIVSYYEQQSVAILGREIRQILLLHANALNARMVDALAQMMKGRGYEFITLDRALEDPAYQLEDAYVGPGGITWLHRWALTQKKPGKIFAGEPAVPAWIEEAARPPQP